MTSFCFVFSNESTANNTKFISIPLFNTMILSLHICTGMHNGYSPWLQFKKMMEKLIKHKQNALEMKTHLQKNNNSSHYIHSCKVIHFTFNNIFKEKPEATSLNVSWHFILNVHIKLQLKRKITSYFEHANFMLSAIQCSFIRRLHFKKIFRESINIIFMKIDSQGRIFNLFYSWIVSKDYYWKLK